MRVAFSRIRDGVNNVRGFYFIEISDFGGRALSDLNDM